MDKFNVAMDFVLKSEGGYVNDPRDPGGETNLGVTDKQDGKIDGLIDVDGDGIGDVSVKGLTIDQAKIVYRRNYWDKVHGDELSPGRALILVDTAVNMGVSRAIKLAQRVSNLTEDGVFGPKTLAAAKTFDIQAYANARLAIYQQLNGWPTYGKGWTNRVHDVATRAKEIEQ
jgi:lysozyme family protein